MCVTPILVNGVEVPCQQCWQCREDRVRDWVGRCIAETKTSFASTVFTLTYGQSSRMGSTDNDFHANVLCYEDVQNFFKSLRWYKFPVRYFAVGEYGSRKGRAHWHVICFWQSEKLPSFELRRSMKFEPYWPHGFAFADEADQASIRYAMKYIVKDLRDGLTTKYGLSRKPPLGVNYFRELARLHVDHGLSPRDLRYSFADVKKRDGTPVVYWLKRQSAFHYLTAFDEEWQLKYHNQDWPNSELMDQYVDIRDKKSRRVAGLPDTDNEVFLDYYFHDSVIGIKKYFGGEKKQWTLEPDVAAIEIERRMKSGAEFQKQYRERKRAG